MAEPLTREDYDYILASLKYAHYAQEQMHYPAEFMKHQQEACLRQVEIKLRALRDELERKPPAPCNPELF